MNFFKLYIGDYQRDTAHLSIAEHGAYMLMLQHYYATEKPLPVGKALHRMLRAQDKTERDAIDTVAAQFWVESDAGLDNSRATEEIRKAVHQRTVNQEIGKRGGRPKATGHKTESVSESDGEREPINNPNHSQTPKKEKEPPNPPAANAASMPDGFANFWHVYPRHTGKANAVKAWAKLKPNEELQAQILASVAVQAKSRDWLKDGGQFIPHPATWLNGRRWEDETDRTIAPSGVFAGVRVDNMEAA